MLHVRKVWCRSFQKKKKVFIVPCCDHQIIKQTNSVRYVGESKSNQIKSSALTIHNVNTLGCAKIYITGQFSDHHNINPFDDFAFEGG